MQKIDRTTKILAVLNMSYLRYSNYRDICFSNWCVTYSIRKRIGFYNMVIHKGLCNWYLDQWQMVVEQLFYNDFKKYIDAGVKDPIYMELFKKYPDVIEKYYPGVLLKMVIKEQKTDKHEVR